MYKFAMDCTALQEIDGLITNAATTPSPVDISSTPGYTPYDFERAEGVGPLEL